MDVCKRKLATQLQSDPEQAAKWIRNGVVNADQRKRYEEARVKFLHKLVAAILTSGQPVRRPEIVGPRWVNTLKAGWGSRLYGGSGLGVSLA